MAHALDQRTEYKLSQSAITDLRNALRGALLQPDDPGYREARSIWNGMVAKEPALIARVSGTSDVIACVNFARENGLPLSIRGGGHNIAGTALCDGGLTIDMSLRRGVRVDPDRGIARVEGGATWIMNPSPWGWSFPAALYRTPVLPDSRWEEDSAGLPVNSVTPRITLFRWTSSPRMASVAMPTRRRTPTCSGHCAVAAAISEPLPPLSSKQTGTDLGHFAAWSCTR